MKEFNLNYVLGLFMAILVANCVVMGLVLFEIQGLRADLAAIEPIEVEILEASDAGADEADNYIEEVPEKPVESVTEPITEVVEVETVTEPVTETETVTESVVEEPTVVYFDVPMPEAWQDHLLKVCEDYNVDPELVVGLIDKESDFDPACEYHGAQGLMQVMPKWHGGRMKELGCYNLFDPYQNITVGVDYLAELLGRGKGVEWALMAYNGGPSYANKKVAAGEISSYASTVLGLAENYKR